MVAVVDAAAVRQDFPEVCIGENSGALRCRSDDLQPAVAVQIGKGIEPRGIVRLGKGPEFPVILKYLLLLFA